MTSYTLRLLKIRGRFCQIKISDVNQLVAIDFFSSWWRADKSQFKKYVPEVNQIRCFRNMTLSNIVDNLERRWDWRYYYYASAILKKMEKSFIGESIWLELVKFQRHSWTVKSNNCRIWRKQKSQLHAFIILYKPHKSYLMWSTNEKSFLF